MTDTKVDTYKGYEIFVDSEKGDFFATKDNARSASAKTLENLRKKLNELSKAAFLGVKVWWETGFRDYDEEKVSFYLGEIVGSTERKTRYGDRVQREYRAKRIGGDRDHYETRSAGRYTKDTPKNRELMGKIHEINLMEKKLAKEKEKFEEQLVTFTDEELLGVGKGDTGE